MCAEEREGDVSGRHRFSFHATTSSRFDFGVKLVARRPTFRTADVAAPDA